MSSKTALDKDEALFLGLDLSTQGLKAALIDSGLNTAYERSVNFDDDLPEFETEGGVRHHADGLTVTAPSIMWVAALDMLLDAMAAESVPLARVVAVSGSGQQHGSVWLTCAAADVLRGLSVHASLREQLKGVFSVPESPIWMDASTSRQCRELEAALGGPQAVADLTGSRAYERFTGNQIAKIWQTTPDQYEATGRIALVSSFMASLLIGDLAPVDTSDGAGMNLMDLRTKAWAPAALAATAPGLDAKLGPIVPGHAVVGGLHSYFVEKYGFRPDCSVMAFSGDNPNSLAGLRLQKPGDIAISLGTSDTLFGSVLEPIPSATEGHVFANPVDPNAYMVMAVRQNGSLTRERLRDAHGDGSWDAFSAALAETPVGNAGRIGFYVDEPEITPPIQKTGTRRFDENDQPVGAFASDVDIRAVVEGQFLAMRLHGGHIGLEPAGILATGGASANLAIIRVVSDVFGVPVFVGDQPDSAALGAAYRALHGWACRSAGRFVPFADVLTGAPGFKKAADPDPVAHEVYAGMLDRYRVLEDRVVADAAG